MALCVRHLVTSIVKRLQRRVEAAGKFCILNFIQVKTDFFELSSGDVKTQLGLDSQIHVNDSTWMQQLAVVCPQCVASFVDESIVHLVGNGNTLTPSKSYVRAQTLSASTRYSYINVISVAQ